MLLEVACFGFLSCQIGSLVDDRIGAPSDSEGYPNDEQVGCQIGEVRKAKEAPFKK